MKKTKKPSPNSDIVDFNITLHTKEYCVCPVCNIYLKTKNIRKHFKKAHNSSIKTKPVIAKHKKIDNIPSGKIAVEKTYYKCWKCGKLFPKSSTASHLKDKHGFIAKEPDTAYFWYFDEVKKIQYRNLPTITQEGYKRLEERKIKNKETRVYYELEDKVKKLSKNKHANGASVSVDCPFCKTTVHAKNLKKHFKRLHEINKNENQILNKLPQEPIEPEKIKLEKPDHEYSEDIFDRAIVYSGGAYGLGKSRKH